MTLARRLFDLLASLKLAVVTLLALAAVLATATFLESARDAETARHYVYQTRWFAALLGLLWLNVLFAALSRWPWKRRHTGFLITHLGILILLVGAFVSLLKGHEGQVIVEEGQSTKRLTLFEPQIFVHDHTRAVLDAVPADFRFSPPDAGDPFRAEVAGGVRIAVDKYLPHAVREETVTPVEGPANPALHVRLSGARGEVDAWLFTREHDRNTVKAGPASVSYVETEDRGAFERALRADGGNDTHRLVIARTPGGGFLYAVKTRSEWTPVKTVALGAPTGTGWMDMTFTLIEDLPAARSETAYHGVPGPDGGKGPAAAVHLTVSNGAGSSELWLAQGEGKDVRLGGALFSVAYGLKSLPLGYEITLDDFTATFNEGTDDPAAFESRVTITDPARPAPERHTISMNEPLQYGGYRIFQSSFGTGPSGKERSVFTVSRDPGIDIKYVGALIMTCGIVIIFFLKRFFAGPRAAARKTPMAAALLLSALSLLAGATARAEAEWPAAKPGYDFNALRGIAIQDGGRKKPFDTFAREAVRTATGREKFAGLDPAETLLSWMTETKRWETLPFLDAGYAPLRRQLGLAPEGRRAAPKELIGNAQLQSLLESVAAKEKSDRKLDDLEKNAAALYARLKLFQSVASGGAWAVAPRAGAWDSLRALDEKYPDLPSIWSDAGHEGKLVAGARGLLAAYHGGDTARFSEFSALLADSQRAMAGSSLDAGALAREIRFNGFRPFRWSWILYAPAFFLLLLSLRLKGSKLYLAGMALLAAGFAVHAYGFYLRMVISGRPPVTNMYETVIWVSFGVVLLGLAFEAIYRARYPGTAAAAVATLFLLLADSVPSVLDPAIHPLVPVLRSNYWLTVHVLTITLSYAAFALALGVAHACVFYYLLRPSEEGKIRTLNEFLYRSIQVGVTLLAAGTILGGVWANSAWGRFWGWDPKEVWALITLLGYLAILHGRYAGWLRGFGLAIGAIAAFLLVVMAWYGVNFVLGQGLHSYGFSSGGSAVMKAFVLVELTALGAAVSFRKRGPRGVVPS